MIFTKKSFAAGFLILSLIGTMNMQSFAAESRLKSNSAKTAVSVSEVHCKSQLTPEQKADIEAKRKAWATKMQDSQKKWSALTDAEKNKIYDLIDKQIDIKIQAIDQMATNGVIDKDIANKMKTRLTERKAHMRKSGAMPLLGFGKRSYQK